MKKGFDRTKFFNLLDEHGVRQTDVANYLGITQSGLSMLVNGQRKMSVETAVRIADYFDIKVEDIINQ